MQQASFRRACDLAYGNIFPVVYVFPDGHVYVWKPNVKSKSPSRFRLQPGDSFIHGITYWLSPFGQQGDFHSFNFTRHI